MKQVFLLLLTFFLTSNFLVAQTNFEQGYYLDNSGNKINCLIKNIDWKNSPEYIIILDSSKEKELKIEKANITEFSVGNFKFIRSTVMLDRSLEMTNSMSESPEPDFNEEVVFLKCLSLGKANLYSFKDNGVTKFFIDKVTGGQEQLLYIPYLVNGIIKRNNSYKSKLLFLNECKTISTLDIQKLNYRKKELVELFDRFNYCFDNLFVNNLAKTEKGFFRISPKISFNSSNIYVNASNTNVFNIKTNKTFISYGVDLEYVFGFNNKKWSLYFNPFFEKLEFDFSNERLKNIKFSYQAIIARFGGKHYMFLNKNSKLSLLAGLNVSYSNDSSEVKYLSETFTKKFKILTPVYANIGLGYTYLNKYTIEFSYDFGKQVFSVDNISTNFNNSSVSLSYNLL